MKLCIILLLAAQSAYAQFTENFNDGDLLNGPVWNQVPGAFIINAQGELQSAWQQPHQTFQITTPSTQVSGAWHFSVRLNLSTSGTNYADVYLMSSDDALTSSGNTGYFMRIGGTPDEISLFRKDADREVCVVDGTNGTVQANRRYDIQVIRDQLHQWTIIYYVDGRLGEVYQGIMDGTYTTAQYFGISVTQSTASFFEKHYFDDMYVGPHIPDTTPPAIRNVQATDSVTAKVEFDEAVRWNGYLPSFFYLGAGVGFPQQVDCNGNVCVLRFQTALPERTPISIQVEDVMDVWGNVAAQLTDTIYYVRPQWGDVILHEIFADPEPPQQMPLVEWVEIRNVSPYPVQLGGWRICKGAGGCSGAFPEYVLLPDSVLILTSSNGFAPLFVYGSTLSVPAFPSLNNAADVLYLTSADDKLIHSVAYNDTWYDNPLKKVGGWSLEMKDVHHPCVGEGNWISSVDGRGATPGQYNSVAAAIQPDVRFQLERSYALDSMHVQLFFSAPLDVHGINQLQQQIQLPGITIDSIVLLEPMLKTVQLRLGTPLLPETLYTLTVRNVRSCSGEVIQSVDIPLALGYSPMPGDVIVHEVLFNPTPAGTDFVEIYNRSHRAVDLKYLYIAHESTTGNTAQITQVHPNGFTMFPGGLIALSNDGRVVQSEYYCKYPERLLDVVQLPSYNDDKGTVILLNHAGEEVDRVGYQSDWHFPLLTQAEGVSLERIHREGSGNRREVWHSASRDVGYATPGYENSQHITNTTPQANYTFSVETISPNNDGRDDFLTIQYTFAEAGYMSNVIIFDIHGRAVRYLHKNILNGTSGTWRWDGLGERMQVLPTGRYIVYIEAFDTGGKLEKFKKVINIFNQ